jgi:hypothetical protein
MVVFSMSNNNFDEIVDEMKKQKSNKDAQDFLMKKMTPSQTSKLQEVMNDKIALQKLLSTPEAKALLKKFLED